MAAAADNTTASVKTSPAERRIAFVAAAVGVLLTVAAGWIALQRAGGPLVTLSYDVPFLWHRANGTGDLRIVYIDSIDESGTLVRKNQAALLDKLNEAGAKAIIYDIMFVSPSDDPAVDKAFAASLRRFRGVDESDNAVPGAQRRKVFLACGRELIRQAGVTGERLIPPTAELLSAADDLGVVPVIHDDAFTVRELSTGTPDEGSLTWKMAIALNTRLSESTRHEPRWINYAGPPKDPDDKKETGQSSRSGGKDDTPSVLACSDRNVFDGFESGFVRDKIVIIGGRPGIAGTAAGQDLFTTPFHRFDRRGDLPLMSGVEIQANMLANLLNENWLTRSSPGFDVTFIIVAGLLAGAGLSSCKPGRSLAAAIASTVILTMAGIGAVHYGRAWFPWSVAAFLQMPVALVWGTASHYYRERHFRVKLDADQIRLRAAFARYLSPQMLDRLTLEQFHMKVGGEKVMAAMMFTDIESFTEMCQRVRDPERIVATLNDYFHRTTGHIFDHDGVIIKFIGDAIFAAWGVPLRDDGAVLKAVRAAWKLSQSDQLTVDGMDLKTRIGVHFGEVVAGNIGTDRHVDYTLIGDAVNLAARLEGLNKILDTHVLVSSEVAVHLAPEFRTRRVGKFQVKGRREITEVHELLGPVLQLEEPDWVTAYHAGLDALENGDHASARTHFEYANTAHGRYGDGPSRFFLECLSQGELLPGGVVAMKEK